MNAGRPPRAMRVATLRDRVVLHDTSSSLRGSDPSARNALIDAANAADPIRRAAPSAPPAPARILVDVNPSVQRKRRANDASGHVHSRTDRYLVIPFLTRSADGVAMREPFETNDAVVAGVDDPSAYTAPVEAAAGFLGLLRLHSASYCVIVSQIRNAGLLPSGPVMSVYRVKMLKLGAGSPSKEDREFANAVTKLLEAGTLYYSLDFDITRSLDKSTSRNADSFGSPQQSETRVGNAFWWTWPMARLGGSVASSWALRTIYGFVSTQHMRFSADPLPTNASEFSVTVVSRRSRRRAGTRYITRGADALGDVANFVETEQVVWSAHFPEAYSSFVIIRGSVPVFWRQNNGIARPSPELDGTLLASRQAFLTHFKRIVRSYGAVTAVSLVDMRGSEAVLAEAFERHFELDITASFNADTKPKLVAFDFHSKCNGKEYERGLVALRTSLVSDIRKYGFSTSGIQSFAKQPRQCGVFRVNCVDCLDRTNVVQSMLARVVLDMQLHAVFSEPQEEILSGGSLDLQNLSLFADSEDRFKHLWGDNADAISKQYSGTGAMKTDYTRTGKRSTTGIVGDGVKSVVRMYYKNFVDVGRQEAIDILCGYASVRPHPAQIGGGNSAEGDGDDDVDANDLAVVASRAANGSAMNSLSGALSDNEKESEANNSSSDFSNDCIDSSQLQLQDQEKLLTWRAASNILLGRESPLWYSFRAMRVSGGGDRQAVVIELRDSVMHLATSEGVSFQFPRRGLLHWGVFDDFKSNERKCAARLRLTHFPMYAAPATASPLDLLFRTGPTARENFLRAYLTWCKPQVLSKMKGHIRVRVLSARGVSKHKMSDWGLSPGNVTDPAPSKCGGNEIVVITVPEGHSDTRTWGLAAVPVDVDHSDYVLISAKAVSSRGPAIAVLASKTAAGSVMSVTESAVGRAGSLTGGGAVAIALNARGRSFCFVSARLGGPRDLFRVLTALKLRRNMFDVTNQFEHFYIAGVMGDLQWREGDVPRDGPLAREFLKLGDGSKAYSLGNGLSVLRSSFPLLPVENLLSPSSFWQQQKSELPSGDDTKSASVKDSSHDISPEAMTGKEAVRPHGMGPALAVCLIDEVVEGGRAPQLPKELTRCVVTLSELRGEGLRIPPGVDPNMPLNTCFAVYSDFLGSDPVVTRPTQRPTDCPEWRETVRLILTPSDANDLRDSYLLGQVMIPTPLADSIPVGHCVLPVSFGSECRAEFNIPLRLAGIATGRLRGIIAVDMKAADREYVPDVASGISDSANSSPATNGGSLDGEFGQTVSRGADLARSNSVASSAKAAMSTGIANFAPSSFQQKMALEDVNEKLDIARRKGSKQIKSMVGKLSSLLNQSGPGPTSCYPDQLQSGKFPTSANDALPTPHEASATAGRERRSSRSFVKDPNAESIADDNSGPKPRSSANFPAVNSGLSGQDELEVFGLFENGTGPSQPSVECISSDPSASLKGKALEIPASSMRREPVTPHTSDPLLVALSSPPRSKKREGKDNAIVSDDPLLRSLSRGHSRKAEDHAVVEDDLLSGLNAVRMTDNGTNGKSVRRSTVAERRALKDDDFADWGTFEQAEVDHSPNSRREKLGGSREPLQGTTPSSRHLLDF